MLEELATELEDTLLLDTAELDELGTELEELATELEDTLLLDTEELDDTLLEELDDRARNWRLAIYTASQRSAGMVTISDSVCVLVAVKVQITDATTPPVRVVLILQYSAN